MQRGEQLSLEGIVETVTFHNAENGFTVLERVKDYNERERAVMARYTREEE